MIILLGSETLQGMSTIWAMFSVIVWAGLALAWIIVSILEAFCEDKAKLYYFGVMALSPVVAGSLHLWVCWMLGF